MICIVIPSESQAHQAPHIQHVQADKHSDSDGARILRALPDSLRARVAQHQFGGVLARNQALFRGCAAQFEGALLGRLREVGQGSRPVHASNTRRAQALRQGKAVLGRMQSQTQCAALLLG